MAIKAIVKTKMTVTSTTMKDLMSLRLYSSVTMRLEMLLNMRISLIRLSPISSTSSDRKIRRPSETLGSTGEFDCLMSAYS